MSDLFLGMYIRGALAGDPEDAKILLRRAADDMEAGRLSSEPLRSYLIEAFRNIADNGVKPHAALRLNKRRGLKSRLDPWTIRNECDSELSNPGTTKEAAFATVAERYCCDASRVKKIYLRVVRDESNL